jgi:hypothetical protein
MLIAIDRYARGVFDPDDVRVLVAAFEDAWRLLAGGGVKFETDDDRNAMRNEIAKFIIEQARTGERDQRRLRDAALLYYARLTSKSRPHK